MNRSTHRLAVSLTLCLWLMTCTLSLLAQNVSSTESVVPRLMNFSGKTLDAQGKPISGVSGVNFSIYKDQEAGAPLWMETQNVQADNAGRYTVQLGASRSTGLPAELFSTGEARWLGVQIHGQAEQPRTLMLSVPYALKALDAETLGGKPISSFMLSPGAGEQANSNSVTANAAATTTTFPISCASSTGCKTNFIPRFSTNGGSAKVVDSIMSQSGTTMKIAGAENVTGNITGGSLNASTTSSNAITGTLTGSGNQVAGVFGNATATGAAGFTFGVIGESASATGRGVFGLASGLNGIGVVGEIATGSAGIGVVGKALPGSTGYGIYGNALSSSSTGSQGYEAGIWGDTGISGSSTPAAAVLGTADDTNAGIFINNSNDFYTLFASSLNTNGFPFHAFNFANQTGCQVDPSGDLNCTGSKNAVVPLDGGKRKVALSAIESPANWFEDFGSAQLINGVAVVRLDPDFIQTVNTEKEYRVFPVPNGDCRGLYVAKKTGDSFEVRELGGGTSNVNFDYRITAIRRKYENVRFADHTNDPDPMKMLEAARKHRTRVSSPPASDAPALPSAQVASHH